MPSAALVATSKTTTKIPFLLWMLSTSQLMRDAASTNRHMTFWSAQSIKMAPSSLQHDLRCIRSSPEGQRTMDVNTATPVSLLSSARAFFLRNKNKSYALSGHDCNFPTFTWRNKHIPTVHIASEPSHSTLRLKTTTTIPSNTMPWHTTTIYSTWSTTASLVQRSLQEASLLLYWHSWIYAV